jgi:hypothetical protein
MFGNCGLILRAEIKKKRCFCVHDIINVVLTAHLLFRYGILQYRHDSLICCKL